MNEAIGSWIVIVVLMTGVIWMVASARRRDRAERRQRVMNEMTRIAGNRAKQRDMDEILATAIDPLLD